MCAATRGRARQRTGRWSRWLLVWLSNCRQHRGPAAAQSRLWRWNGMGGEGFEPPKGVAQLITNDLVDPGFGHGGTDELAVPVPLARVGDAGGDVPDINISAQLCHHEASFVSPGCASAASVCPASSPRSASSPHQRHLLNIIPIWPTSLINRVLSAQVLTESLVDV